MYKFLCGVILFLLFSCEDSTNVGEVPVPKMKLISSAGKSFTMGLRDSLGLQDAIALKVHRVTFTYDFWMDSTEVSQFEYERLMGNNPSIYIVHDDFPAMNISWINAILFCNERSKEDGLDTIYQYEKINEFLNIYGDSETEIIGLNVRYNLDGYRLPTEAEWEYACRAGSETKYYWGNEPSGIYANGDAGNGWENDGFPAVAAVANFQPNSFGLYDMIGNVWEWCTDSWTSGFYEKGDVIDPINIHDTDIKILRGGSCFDGATNLRSGFRANNNYYLGRSDFGFRTVRPVLK